MEKFQAVTGGNPGDPWCADCVSYCGLKALDFLEGKPSQDVDTLTSLCHDFNATYWKISGGVVDIMDDAKARGHWLPVAQARDKNFLIEPGWLVIYQWADGGHHIGMVVYDKDYLLHTVEGNTGPQPGSETQERDGDGVYQRTRGFGNVLGFVRTYEA